MFENKLDQRYWNQLVKKYDLDQLLQEKFKSYFDLIVTENQKYNITAITSVKGVSLDHFYDSLALVKLYDLSNVKSIADIGSGGGFPGLPLAIMNPNIHFHLVEVNQKKINFLNMVVDKLGLQNVTVHSDDFRTFVRNFGQSVDIFTARASLSLKELTRIFKPSSLYKNALLIYWASTKWKPTSQESLYLQECKMYNVGDKQRSLCFFRANS